MDDVLGHEPLVAAVPPHDRGVAERDVVDVEQYFVGALLVPDLPAGVPGVWSIERLTLRISPGPNLYMRYCACDHELVMEASRDRYDEVGGLFRVLASPVRVALVDLLADQELLVHQLVAATGLAQPLVSQHLKVLRDARLVRRVRRGREMVYTLSDDHVAHIVRDAIAHMREEEQG